MNELVVPPAPHWYKGSVVACAPDNTLVYGSKNDIVILKEKTPEEAVQVQVIHGAHSKHIVSVSLNKKWKDPHSYVVSLGEDNVIKVWNLDTLEKKTTNKDHMEHKEPVIGAVFAGDDRVVSAALHGLIIVWNINTNESKPLNNLFKTKVTLTCLSSCPHAAWLLAFGLSTGCVVVADLRRNGQLLYNLRGHYQSVVSLSWCPAPVNVFPRFVNNRVRNKSQSTEKAENAEKVLESTDSKIGEIRVKEKKVNPWVNLTHADDDEVALEKENTEVAEVRNFLKECDDLKKVILGLEVAKEIDEQSATKSKNEETEEIVTEKFKGPEVVEGRPLPKLFDPSGDFLDDSCFDDPAIKEIESKNLQPQTDGINEETIQNEEEKVEEAKETELENFSENKDLDGDSPTDDTDEKIQKEEYEAEKTKNTDESLLVEDLSEDKDLGDEKSEDKRSEAEDTQKDSAAKSEDLEGENKDDPPKEREIIEEEPRTEYLLASSGKDKSIYIWRAGTDGRMQTYFCASKRNTRREKNPNSWISLCWVTPDTILTSSTTGEILAWPVPKPKDSSKQCKVVHFEHSTLVFNIVTPPKYQTAYNWRDNVDLSIWTWGQEGKLVNYDLSGEKMRFSYPTVTATVTCFATSSLDPNRLALGLRDGGIRVWDLSLPHTNIVNMQKFQQKITHKVSALAWHPQKEMVLGFGTEEGRVGFMTLLTKKSSLFPHYFQSQVYKVEWGPIRGSVDNLGLYIVAEGKMAIYDMQKPDADPIHLELPDKLHVYKFAWKPNYTTLLLNGKDGSFVVLNRDFLAIATFYPSDKGSNSIVWHPDSVTDNTETSSRCNWFAATTNKGVIVIDTTSIGENNFVDKIVASFEGHLKPPLALVWCPFEGNRIASTAADGLCHVWDVTSKSAIATLLDFHLSHNKDVAWSPVEPDLIITGDKVLRIWSISQNAPKIDEEFMATRKRFLNKYSKNEPEKVDKNKIKVSISVKPKSNPKNCIVPAFYVSNDENIATQVESMRKLMDGDETQDSLQIFGSKDQVASLLDANYNQQSKEGKYKSCEMISLWKGNVGEYVQNAIKENRVTPSLIALAPMVSSRLWQDACLTYAKKLSEDSNSDCLETAAYFLACHKVEEAIDCLCLNSMFKEALALAKHRLPESSDIIAKVVERWAEHCKNTGNFENAAYCYISVKDYENAAKVLARRSHKEFLEFALELAEKAGNQGLCDSIKFKFTELENKDEESEKNVAVSKSEEKETSFTVADEEVSDLCKTEEGSEDKTHNQEHSLKD